MHFVPFRADHVLDLADRMNEVQRAEASFMLGDAHLESLVELEQRPGMSFTAMDAENTVLGCGGVFHIWPQRAMAWMISQSGWGAERENVRHAIRFIRRFLSDFPAVRIEATVLHGYEPGYRWARHLGFTLEAECMRCYDPEGRDYALFARIRE